MERLRKAFTVSVMMVTILSMSMVLVAPANAAVAQAGDLIKMDGLSSVYYLAADGKRYVFPNETTYFSWYSDFSTVKTISQSELESYPLGANVTVRPGTKLVKITTDPKVYAVTSSGELKWVPDEATAKALFGDNWAKRVVDVPDSFIGNYKVNGKAYGNKTESDVNATKLTSAAYPEGSLIKKPDSSDIYYIASDGKARKIANEAAMTANRLKMTDVITTTSSFTLPTMGSDITGAESALMDTSSGAGGAAGAGTGLTVALASDTPAADTILSDGGGVSQDAQALIAVLKLNFTASSDGDVKVTTLKFNRTGISSDSDVDNVYLYDGGNILSRLAEMQSISSKVVTFTDANGLFTVPAGTTKSILVRFDLNRDSTSGKTIGFNVVSASDIVTNGASVSGSFPMTGNMMSTATVTDFGTVNISRVADNSTAVDPGSTGFTAAHYTLAPAYQNLQLEYLKFQMIGSAAAADVTNIKLYDGTTQLGSTQQLGSDKTVAFDLTGSPLAISSSQTKHLYLKVDVASGSTRTFYFSIQKKSDIIVKDTAYDIYITPNNGTIGTFASQDSSQVTIGSGSITVSKSTESPTGNIADGATNLTFAKYSMKATGEDIKVSNIGYACISNDTSALIDNVKILIDGVQQGTTNTTGITCNGTTSATTTLNFTVPSGTTKYLTIVGDTTDSTVTENDTFKFTLNIGASNGQRMSSLGTVNVPGARQDANTLTVKAGTVTSAKNTGMGDASSASPTGVAGRMGVRIGSFTVTAGAGEDVDVTKITLIDNGTDALGDEFQNLLIKDQSTGAQFGSIIGTLQTSTSYSYEFSPAAALRITNGQTKIFDIYADILSNASKTSSAYNAVKVYAVYATGVSTASAADDTNARTLQNVYLAASGTLTIEDVPASDQVQSNIVYASDTATNVVELYKFKLTALVEQMDITRFVITDTITAGTATTANGKPTTTLYNFELYDGTTKVAGPVSLYSTSTPTNGGYIDFNLGSGSPFTIPAGVSKVLTLKATVNTWDQVSSGATHSFKLHNTPLQDSSVTRAITARGHDSNVSKDGPSSALTGGNNITVRKSYPVVTRLALPTTTLNSGSTDGVSIAKYSVTATGNDIRLKKLTFNVTLNDTTTSTLMSLSSFKLYRNGTEMGSSEYAIFDGSGTAQADELSHSGTATLSTDTLKGSLGAANSTSTRMVVVFSTRALLAAGQTGSGEETIAAGSTNTYEIKCNVANAHQGATTDSDSVVVTLLGEDSISSNYTGNLSNVAATTYRFGVVGLNSTNYNFVWSDYSANIGDHTSTIPSTGGDWTYGYQVRSTASTPASYIPLDSWTLSK